MPFLSLSPPFFSFYVLHADAGEKSPRTQEIETRNSCKNKNKKYGRRLPGYSKNPRVRTEFSQVNLTRLRIDFRKQEPVSYLRLNRFLYRGGLTAKVSPNRFIKNRFLTACFYCIVCMEVQGHGLPLKT